jgi:hypothetical protein
MEWSILECNPAALLSYRTLPGLRVQEAYGKHEFCFLRMNKSKQTNVLHRNFLTFNQGCRSNLNVVALACH